MQSGLEAQKAEERIGRLSALEALVRSVADIVTGMMVGDSVGARRWWGDTSSDEMKSTPSPKIR